MPQQQPADPPALRIPPPSPVRFAAFLLLLQAAGVVVFAGLTAVSGFSHSEVTTGFVLGQVAYFLVIAAAIAACGVGLLQGRRWARTPAIVIQLVIGGIGVYLALPSEQLAAGLALIAAAVVTAGALLTAQANQWVNSFPSPFGAE